MSLKTSFWTTFLCTCYQRLRSLLLRYSQKLLDQQVAIQRVTMSLYLLVSLLAVIYLRKDRIRVMSCTDVCAITNAYIYAKFNITAAISFLHISQKLQSYDDKICSERLVRSKSTITYFEIIQIYGTPLISVIIAFFIIKFVEIYNLTIARWYLNIKVESSLSLIHI